MESKPFGVMVLEQHRSPTLPSFFSSLSCATIGISAFVISLVCCGKPKHAFLFLFLLFVCSQYHPHHCYAHVLKQRWTQSFTCCEKKNAVCAQFFCNKNIDFFPPFTFSPTPRFSIVEDKSELRPNKSLDHILFLPLNVTTF